MQMFVYSAVTAGNLQTLLQSLRRLSAPESVSDSLERPWALQVTTDHHLMGALRTVNFISISFFVRANACIWRRVMQPPWTISDDDEEEASLLQQTCSSILDQSSPEEDKCNAAAAAGEADGKGTWPSHLCKLVFYHSDAEKVQRGREAVWKF